MVDECSYRDISRKKISTNSKKCQPARWYAIHICSVCVLAHTCKTDIDDPSLLTIMPGAGAYYWI